MEEEDKKNQRYSERNQTKKKNANIKMKQVMRELKKTKTSLWVVAPKHNPLRI